jgi:DNA-binding transcriptional regulator YiaG
MKNKTKILNEYWAHELGLPILIKGAPVIEIDGYEVLDLDYAKISSALFAALILKPYPFTGAEVKFLRLFMGLTLERLASYLHVTHPTILTWEKSNDKPTRMGDSTEAMLRILAAKQGVRDDELVELILNRFFDAFRKARKAAQAYPIVELSTLHKNEISKVFFVEDSDPSMLSVLRI